MHRIREYSRSGGKWIMLGILCGCLVGPVGGLFAHFLDFCASFRGEHPWLLYLLPVGGLLVVFAYRHCAAAATSTDAVFRAVREHRPLAFVTAPLIFLATGISQLLGGSAGREGAALQLGGSITGSLGRRMKMQQGDLTTMTMCGMAAAFSAVFGTPVTATIFALEVVDVGLMHYAALVPTLLAALVGGWISQTMGVAPHFYEFEQGLNLNPLSMAQVIGLGVLLAVLSIAVCFCFHNSGKLLGKVMPNPYIRVAVGGTVIVLLTLLVGDMTYNGAGGEGIHHAIEGNARPWDFAMKILFTALTLGAGYKGGEIVPVFFIGSTFGCVVGPLLGIPAGFAASLGMVGLFCGVTNSPLASILLAMELYDGKCLPLFCLVCVVSYMLSASWGLYHEQRILGSKLKIEA